MSEFFAMGGYAAFVWSSYAVAAVVMVAMLVASLRGLRRQQRAVRLLEEARGKARSDRQQAPVSAIPESGP
jgi:heme exporter protein D